jgi:hypothetical protein
MEPAKRTVFCDRNYLLNTKILRDNADHITERRLRRIDDVLIDILGCEQFLKQEVIQEPETDIQTPKETVHDESIKVIDNPESDNVEDEPHIQLKHDVEFIASINYNDFQAVEKSIVSFLGTMQQNHDISQTVISATCDFCSSKDVVQEKQLAEISAFRKSIGQIIIRNRTEL